MDVSKLSHGAAKLLLATMLIPETPRTPWMLRATAGITDHRTYTKAVAELADKVGIDVVMATTFTPEIGKACSKACSNGDQIGKACSNGNHMDYHMDYQTGTGNHMDYHAAPLPPPPVLSLLDAVDAADRLDGSGEPTLASSPYQARRKAQIAALSALFVDIHPYATFSTESAKELLVLAKDNAGMVGRLLEKTRGRKLDYPVGYLKRAVSSEAAKQPAKVVSTQAAAGEYGPTDPDILRPVTDADRAKWDEATRRLKAAGLYVEP